MTNSTDTSSCIAGIVIIGVMTSITILSGCRNTSDGTSDIRSGIQNFYSYQYFTNYYKNFEEREEIATRDNYAEFIEFAAAFYEQRLDADEIGELAKFFSSRGAAIYRDMIIDDQTEYPLWEYSKLILADRMKDDNVGFEWPEADADDLGNGELWTCHQHPRVRVREDGACPICGMTLDPVHRISSA